jgi:hypothetical protein
MPVTAKPLIHSLRLPTHAEITEVHHSSGVLKVVLEGLPQENRIVVRFANTEGFRVLDEGFLLEFWDECTTPKGLFFEIFAGGWLEQEQSQGRILKAIHPDLREFLVTGIDFCISVFSKTLPEMSYA